MSHDSSSRRLEGKVALVTGAAGGIGRAQAVRFARDGARLILTDRAVDSGSSSAGATASPLEETSSLVEDAGGRSVAVTADVTSEQDMAGVVERGLDAFGRIDIVSANAGILMRGPRTHEIDPRDWDLVQDVNVKGVWLTVRACLPSMLERGEGGAIVLTSSIAGLKGMPGTASYTASKHAVVGLMRSLAVEVAEAGIRVNSVHPTGVSTGMIVNEESYKLILPDDPDPTPEKLEAHFRRGNAMDVAWVEPEDVANAVAWLVSDEARYVTGVALPVDAGALLK